MDLRGSRSVSPGIARVLGLELLVKVLSIGFAVAGVGRMGDRRMQAFRCLLLLWVTLWAACLHFGQCEEVGRGYRMTSIRELHDSSGIVAHLDLIEGSEPYGPDINELRVIAR